MPPTYTVADYLLDRLADCGVTDVFGVPGDFNLGFLDRVLAHPTLRWVGTANELNAGYAADGYGRIRGMAVLVTTYGVGELSAANAVAGSFAEHVPVLHIVGAPASHVQASSAVVHHTLGDGDFGHFSRIASEFTCAQAHLRVDTAAADIDRVLTQMHEHKRPGYLMVPTDVVGAETSPPAGPLDLTVDLTSSSALAEFSTAVTTLIADKPVTVLADVLVQRFGAVQELSTLVEKAGIPYATLMWGKGLLDESSPNFLGIYSGAASTDDVRAGVEDSPILIMAGVLFTDMVSGFFTHRIDAARTIEIGPHHASVGGRTFGPLDMRTALTELTTILGTHPPRSEHPRHSPPDSVPAVEEHTPLSQELLWHTLSRRLMTGDVLLAEQGTSYYGLAPLPLPAGATFIGQPLWASIGYTLPAALGAALADRGRRVVLAIGDGAAQFTIQELGTFARQGLYPVVILVNNDGYTIERAVHGPTAEFNDISPWNWAQVPAALGCQGHLSLRASTVGELATALALAREEQGRMVFLEVILPKLDIPPYLPRLARAAGIAPRRPQHD